MLTYIKIFLIALFTLFCSLLAFFSLLDRTFIIYHYISKLFSGGILLISGVRVKVTGVENISKQKVYVFASNHSSQLDITALQWGVPNQLSMIFKKEIAKIPFFGWQLYLGPYVMVDRSNPEKAMRSIDEAKELMKNKKISILVFPEGTRSKTGEVQPFKRGAFHLAAKVGYPIVPITINGTEQIMPKGTFKLKSGTIHLKFDRPIFTGNLKTRQDEIEMMNKVREIILKNKV